MDYQYNGTQSSYSEIRNVVLAEGETIIKQYQCANVRRPIKCSGVLIVTNRRVLFEGIGSSASSSKITQETAIDKLSGLDSYYGMNIRIWRIILGIIVLIFTFGGLGLLGILIGVYLIYSGIQKCYFLRLYSSEQLSPGITIGSPPGSFLGNGAVFSMSCSPTMETNLMLSEIGSVIHSVQAKGSL